jgi:hypothetical protein
LDEGEVADRQLRQLMVAGQQQQQQQSGGAPPAKLRTVQSRGSAVVEDSNVPSAATVTVNVPAVGLNIGDRLAAFLGRVPDKKQMRHRAICDMAELDIME